MTLPKAFEQAIHKASELIAVRVYQSANAETPAAPAAETTESTPHVNGNGDGFASLNGHAVLAKEFARILEGKLIEIATENPTDNICIYSLGQQYDTKAPEKARRAVYATIAETGVSQGPINLKNVIILPTGTVKYSEPATGMQHSPLMEFTAAL
jgi:hypothetical protein